MQILRSTTNRQASGAMGDSSGDENVSVGEIPIPRVDKFKKGFISTSFLDYLKSIFLTLGDGLPRNLALLDLTIVLTYINYREITIMG